ELVWRARQSFELENRLLEWEKAHKDAQAMQANAKFVTDQTAQRELENELRRRGYTYVRGVNGAAWFDPGVNSITSIPDPKLMEDLMEKIFAFTLKKPATGALKSGRVS